MFKNFSGKFLKFANGLAADYYTKDQKNSSAKSADKKSNSKVKEEANKRS